MDSYLTEVFKIVRVLPSIKHEMVLQFDNVAHN